MTTSPSSVIISLNLAYLLHLQHIPRVYKVLFKCMEIILTTYFKYTILFSLFQLFRQSKFIDFPTEGKTSKTFFSEK